MAMIIDLPIPPQGNLDDQRRYLYRLVENLSVLLDSMTTQARKLETASGDMQAALEQQMDDRWQATRKLITESDTETAGSIDTLSQQIAAARQQVDDLALAIFGSYIPQPTPGVVDVGYGMTVHGPLAVDDTRSGHSLTLGSTVLTETDLAALLALL